MKRLIGTVLVPLLALILGLVLGIAVPSAIHSKAQYAGVAVAYEGGNVAGAKLITLTKSYEQCVENMKQFKAALGDPPPGISADFACVQVVPFVSSTTPGTAYVPKPKTEVSGTTSI